MRCSRRLALRSSSIGSPSYWRTAKGHGSENRMTDFSSIAVAASPAEFAQTLREATHQWANAFSAIGLKR
jgi:hypothetical protein